MNHHNRLSSHPHRNPIIIFVVCLLVLPFILTLRKSETSVSQAAVVAFAKFEDFETMSKGPINSQNDWFGDRGTNIVSDPDIAPGHVEIETPQGLLVHDPSAALAAIREELLSVAQRRVTRGALYRTLERLEGKGLLSWHLEAAGPSRGGHARRSFSVTAAGTRTLRRSRHVLLSLWNGLEEVLS